MHRNRWRRVSRESAPETAEIGVFVIVMIKRKFFNRYDIVSRKNATTLKLGTEISALRISGK